MIPSMNAGAIAAANGVPPGPTDPDFASVELLINGDSGITDLSNNAASITNVGSVTVSGGALIFNGSSQELTLSGISAYQLTTQPWSLECIIDPDTTTSAQAVADIGNADLIFYNSASSQLNVYMDNNGGHNYHHSPVATKTEYGVFWNGSTVYLFENGVQRLGASRGSSMGMASTPGITVGNQTGTSNRFDGKLYALRYTVGVCRHTTAYTPNATDYYPTS